MYRLIILLSIIVAPFLAKAQHIDVTTLDTLATELNIPKCNSITPFTQKGFNKLRRITFNGVDFLPPLSFVGLPNLEEIVFNGDNLVIGGAQFFDLPKLKRIVFNGNTFLMNGSTMVGNTPNFENFEINGLVTVSEIWDPYEAPNFKGYSGDFAMLYNGNSKLITATPSSTAAKDIKYKSAFSKQLSEVTKILDNYKNNLNLARNFMCFHSQILDFAKAFGIDTTEYVSAYNKARQDEYFWSNLEILQHSPEYAADSISVNFTYESSTDNALKQSRVKFNLDSIAGNGDDISRIKNLMYWVHDVVRHDGSSYNPSGPKTLSNLIDSCQQYSRGVNCRMMAIMLTEALLAEGIPARYLTCQSKAYDTDQDCHVICVAWSDSLNKWVWIDPTFAAYVTDENGIMLHPGEVRQRLIDNKPLVLNEDANWNHETQQTKDYYLENYMAKNLYYITAITYNRPAPEGGNSKSVYVTLAPTENNFSGSHIITTDYNNFWQSPN